MNGVGFDRVENASLQQSQEVVFLLVLGHFWRFRSHSKWKLFASVCKTVLPYLEPRPLSLHICCLILEVPLEGLWG